MMTHKSVWKRVFAAALTVAILSTPMYAAALTDTEGNAI